MDLPSFEQEQQHSHCLQLELGQEHLNNWNALSDRQAHLPHQQEFVLSEFDANLPEESHIQDTTQKEEAQKDDFLCSTGEGFLQKEQECQVQQNSVSNSSVSQQEEHTIYEQSNVSASTTQSSGQWPQNMGHQFISLSASTYIPLLSSLTHLTESVRKHSSASADNVNMYYIFLKIKLQQEKERMVIVGRQHSQGQIIRDGMDNLFEEETKVIGAVKEECQEKLGKLAHFCQQLEQSCSRLKNILTKTLEFGTRKIDHILKHLQKTAKVHQELASMLQPSPKKSNWGNKNDMQNDRYLQKKYLQERQKLFLQQLTSVGQKVVALLHAFFLKQQPTAASIIHKQMKRYSQLSRATYGSEFLLPLEEEFDMNRVQRELSDLLASILPREWSISFGRQASSQDIINLVNDYLQNHVFLPCVCIEPELIKIRAEACWLPAFKQSKKDQKQNRLAKANEPTCSFLIVSEPQLKNTNKTKGMTVSVILSADSYLHLQCGEKIACLKLKKLKLKKKGRKSILLMENARNISGLFGASAELGQLTFKLETEAQAFVDAVLSHK